MNESEGEEKPHALHRRAALLGALAAAVGAWWAWPSVAQLFVGDFDFEPLDDPRGFRRIAAGETSGMPSPFFGLEAPDAQRQATPEEEVRADLCAGLFGGSPPAGVVPIASFSDYNCPFCRVLTEILSNLEERAGGGVRITWHEWPRLGPTSVSAARAALAADMQGA